jgi:hypothetical protein
MSFEDTQSRTLKTMRASDCFLAPPSIDDSERLLFSTALDR